MLKKCTLRSLAALKHQYPDLAPFYTQSWVYAAISAFYSKCNLFEDLAFSNNSGSLFTIKDYQPTYENLVDDCVGLVYEGHHRYWIKSEIKNSLIITGHKHSIHDASGNISIGFDFWDIDCYSKNINSVFFYEINRKGVEEAVYDLSIPVGSPREHRLHFLKHLQDKKSNLSIVTSPSQSIVDTELRFDILGLEAYLNKFDIPKFKNYTSYHSFYDTNQGVLLDHLPHKKLHSVCRVSVILETTVYSVQEAYFTEKTYKVLSQRRPFIILGDTNSLLKLRNAGFKTFNKFCDESYDQEENLELRIVKCIEAAKQLVEACKQHPDAINEICEHNQRKFFDGQRHADNLADFGKLFIDTYTNFFDRELHD